MDGNFEVFINIIKQVINLISVDMNAYVFHIFSSYKESENSLVLQEVGMAQEFDEVNLGLY